MTPGIAECGLRNAEWGNEEIAECEMRIAELMKLRIADGGINGIGGIHFESVSLGRRGASLTH